MDLTFFKIVRYDSVLDRELIFLESLDYNAACRWMLSLFNDCFGLSCSSWSEAIKVSGIPGSAGLVRPDGTFSFTYDIFTFKLIEEPYV